MKSMLQEVMCLCTYVSHLMSFTVEEAKLFVAMPIRLLTETPKFARQFIEPKLDHFNFL